MAKQKVVADRNDWGIPEAVFCLHWRLSNSVDEMYLRMKTLTDAMGKKPMPRDIIIARASKLRLSGRNLKHMERKRNEEADKTNLMLELADEKEAAGEPVDIDALIKEAEKLYKEGRRSKKKPEK